MHNQQTPRAHIFQSFDSLKGFRNMLKEKEKIVTNKKELSEDELNILDFKIHQVKIGMIIQIVYYNNHQYIQLEGIVSKLNFDTQIIQIVKTKINLKNIVEINF